MRVRGDAQRGDIERELGGGKVDGRDESLTRVHATDGNARQEIRRSMYVEHQPR